MELWYLKEFGSWVVMRNEEGEGRGVIIELKEKRVESENEIDEKEERINEFINIQ